MVVPETDTNLDPILELDPTLEPEEERRISEEMLLGFFIHEHPDKVKVVPGTVYEAARQSPKGKAYGYVTKPARITMAVPDDVVKNINGAEEKRDWYVLVRVDRAAIEQLEKPSAIIQPTPATTP